MHTPIFRHKAAIRRGDLSLPFKCLVRDQLLSPDQPVFDYGCGHGEDISRLRELGFNCDGWDPGWRPAGPKQAAEVVNLGYVLNVIENLEERTATIREAWNLCQRLLVVAARIVVGGRGNAEVEYGDGILTQLGTFQKFYTQAELRDYLETTLETEALPARRACFISSATKRCGSSIWRIAIAAGRRRRGDGFPKCVLTRTVKSSNR